VDLNTYTYNGTNVCFAVVVLPVYLNTGTSFFVSYDVVVITVCLHRYIYVCLYEDVFSKA